MSEKTHDKPTRLARMYAEICKVVLHNTEQVCYTLKIAVRIMVLKRRKNYGNLQFVLAKMNTSKVFDSVTFLPFPLESFPGTLITVTIISSIID